jgi:uncharacterized membrane protein YgaE (UPF0421/DUF939 family)
VLTRLEALLKGSGPVVLQATKAGVAAGLAWFIAADVIGNNLPVFAPLAAVLTVQVTVWDSVSRGLQRALGVVVGVLLAYALAKLLGIHVWSVALVVFVSWVAGQVLRLGQQGAVQVPVSALLVLVLGASTTGYAVDRVVDTFVGAGVGILVSLVVVPRTNLAAAQAGVRDLAKDTTTVLRDLADSALAAQTDFEALLARARRLDDDAENAALVAERTLTATRWSPTGYRDRAAAEKLLAAVKTLDQVQRSARSISRVMADGARGSELGAGLAEPVADLLRTLADEVDGWAEDVTAEKAAGSSASRVVQRYQAVLSAARATGVTAETAAIADAIAVSGLRISDDLQTELDQRALTRRASWRSLLGR